MKNYKFTTARIVSGLVAIFWLYLLANDFRHEMLSGFEVLYVFGMLFGLWLLGYFSKSL
jgi:uncharacterized membrane protein YqjE